MTSHLAAINMQKEIKFILGVLSWSVNSFSSKYIIDTRDYDVEEREVAQFCEKVKKQLNRTTTKTNKLSKYLSFLKKTAEYEKVNNNSPELLHFEKNKGLITDYQLIINEEQDQKKKKVLEVAVAYALSIGSAWDFKVIPIRFEENNNFFIVIWVGDVGYAHGSGTVGPAMCEVHESDYGHLYVDSEEASIYFDPGVRYIDSIISFKDKKLTLVGYDYGDDDPLCCPTHKYESMLQKTSQGEWKVVSRKFVGCEDLTD